MSSHDALGSISPQLSLFPPTRYMGSKSKLLPAIADVVGRFEFDTALDLFSGSGIVGYLFKTLGKTVVCNDYMAMSWMGATALVENSSVTLGSNKVSWLMEDHRNTDGFVESTFKDLYFSDDENHFIDIVRANIRLLSDPYERALAVSSLVRACIKKRPRGIFTYTGYRYDDGRKDLSKTLDQHFKEAAELFDGAVFDNGRANKALWGDALTVDECADLVYIDPPYYSPFSDNEYVRRYHFVEGIARDWRGVAIQEHTRTKKFKSYPTPFSTQAGAFKAFDFLFSKSKNSIIIVSYSSNGIPSKDEMVDLLKRYKRHVDFIPVDYRYSFGTQKNSQAIRNRVEEYLFVGY